MYNNWSRWGEQPKANQGSYGSYNNSGAKNTTAPPSAASTTPVNSSAASGNGASYGASYGSAFSTNAANNAALYGPNWYDLVSSGGPTTSASSSTIPSASAGSSPASSAVPGAGLSSSGSGPGPYGYAFDDGGAIPDPGDAIPPDPQDPSNTQDTSTAQTETDPLATIKAALAFGRKQAGLPPVIHNSDTSQSDDQDQDDQGAALIPAPAQSFDDGGAVDDSSQDASPSAAGMIPPQGAPQGGAQGGNPKLMAYLAGAGGVSPDVATALEGRVDPRGQMDPSARKMLAVAGAGNPQNQFALMQHYRQKFNAYNAFARAAADGSPQKPADLGAAARAATQAYQNVPDGSSVTFQPSPKGIVASVKQLATGKGAQKGTQKGTQSFDDGGTPLPMPDPRGNPNDPGNEMPSAAPAQDTSDPGDVGDPGGSFGSGPGEQAAIPMGGPETPDQAVDPNAIAGAMGAGPEAASAPKTAASPYRPSAGTTPYTLARDAVTGLASKAGSAISSLMGGSNDSGTNAAGPYSVLLSPPQFNQMLKDAQYDKVMDKGMRNLITSYGVAGGPQTALGGGGDQTPQTPRFVEQGAGLPVVDNSKAGNPIRQGALDPDDVAQANALFPMSSQMKQRQAFIAEQLNQRQTKGASEDLQRLKNEGTRGMWDSRMQGAQTIQSMKGDVSRANNMNTVGGRENVANINQGGINGRNAQATVGRMIDSMLANGARPDDIVQQIPKLAAQVGVTPQQFRQMAAQYAQGGGQQPPEGNQASQQRKFYNGQWYTRGPNGEAVPAQ